MDIEFSGTLDELLVLTHLELLSTISSVSLYAYTMHAKVNETGANAGKSIKREINNERKLELQQQYITCIIHIEKSHEYFALKESNLYLRSGVMYGAFAVGHYRFCTLLGKAVCV